MQNYLNQLLAQPIRKTTSWRRDSRPVEQPSKSTARRVSTVTDDRLTPLEVHRKYTEAKHIRRRGLDGSLRSNMSNRLRDIQLTGR